MTHSIIYSGEMTPEKWELHVLRPDQSKWLHIINKVTFDWRAAEYGVDPADVDTLLDICMHERHIPTRDQEQLDPKLAAKAVPWLYEADNTADALKYHMTRLRAAPIQYSIKGNKALDPIRQSHKPNHDRIKQIKEAVDTHRWTTRYGELPVPKKQLVQVPAIPFVQTGIKGNSLNPSSDSMMIVGSTTITTKGK
jgi:hypothetical protein